MAKKRLGLLATFIVIALLGLVSTLEYNRQTMSAQLNELKSEIQRGGEQQDNKQVAQQVIDDVRSLIDIPADIEPTVATIVDVDTLRAQNPFYNKAENGDYLVVTTERAILYRSSEHKIIDVVPVQLEPADAADAQGSQQ